MQKRIVKAILWLPAFIALFLYRSLYSFDNNGSTTFILCLLDVSILYACSIAINKGLISRLLYRKKYLLFGLGTIALLAIEVLLLQQVQTAFYHTISALPKEVFDVLKTFSYQIFNSWLVVALGCLCIITYRLLGDYLVAEHRYQLLQKEQAQTELNFLKAQINPHFLFNSINSIYAHIDRQNTQAREMMLQFSHLLRYQLYECNTEQIPIEKELAYLKDYVALQRKRKEEELVDIKLETEGATEGYTIPPLLLIPFVENAFKYTSTHDDRSNKLHIRLGSDGQKFQFCCYNTKDSIKGQKLASEGGGIGIHNVRRRLELIYPNNHQLQIQDTDTYFQVNLQFQLS